DALEEAIAEPGNRPLDSLDIDDVVSETKNHKNSGAPAACDACARFVHQGAHAPHGGMEPTENGFANEEMPNVELHNLRDARHGGHRVVREAMAGMDLKTRIRGNARCNPQPFHLLCQ